MKNFVELPCHLIDRVTAEMGIENDEYEVETALLDLERVIFVRPDKQNGIRGCIIEYDGGDFFCPKSYEAIKKLLLTGL